MKKRMILALCLAFVAAEAMAWSGHTHNTIGHIADQHLTPEAKQKCHHYLRHTLAYYASWQDDVAFSKEYAETRFWHGVRYDAKNRYQYREGRNAITHIIRIWDEMKEGGYKKLSDSTIIVNLKLLAHMVGDMHCPCHSKFSKRYFPQYKGKKAVYRGKKEVSYHGFWDGSPAMGRRGWEVEDYAKNVDRVSKKQAAAWQSGTLEDWGRDIAKGAHRGFALYPEGLNIADLTPKERKAIMALADEMAMQGAYRLAHVLNTIFADKSIETR